MQLLKILHSQIKDNKAYYYFCLPISHKEWGIVKERPLTLDEGFTEYAKRDSFFG